MNATIIPWALFIFWFSTLVPAAAQTSFFKGFGTESPVFPTFTASPHAYYFAHGSDNELIKTDLDGNVIWSKRLEFNSTPVSMNRITYLADAILVTGGHAAQHNYLAKLDTAGNVIWSTAAHYGDINSPTRIHATSDGYLTTGHRDFPTGGGYTFDITLTRWSADGDMIWGRVIGDDINDYYGWTSIVLADDEILVAGTRYDPIQQISQPLLARFNENGDLLWMKLLSEGTDFFTDVVPADLIATSDGDLAMVATTYNTFNNFDSHIMKFDGEGNVLWAKRMFQIGWTERAQAIMEDSEGKLVFGGSHSMAMDIAMHIHRFEQDGTPVDGRTIGNFKIQSTDGYYSGKGQDLIQRSDGGYVFAGEFYIPLMPRQHAIASFDLATNELCGHPMDAYPFTFTDYFWTDSLLANPASIPAITEADVELTSVPISTIATDLCLILSVNEGSRKEERIQIHPNPTEGIFSIRNTREGSMISEITIMDVTGKVIKVIDGPSIDPFFIDLNGQRAGVYLIGIVANGTRSVHRIEVL